jgi:hypothetical protein
MNELVSTLAIGCGATATADLWGLLRRPLLGIAPPDYRLVGRWIGHMAHGQVRHGAIAKAVAVRGEHFIGWSAHYLTGVAFAATLVAAAGPDWLLQPTLGPAMAVGVGTVMAPFLVMQPAMGGGIASRRARSPWSARLQSLLMHAVFGFGLYATARALPLLKIS